jgi:hypothetical protein
MVLALTESWSDGVAITGLLVTVAGFVLTLWQLRKTKSAAEAARAAAEGAFAEGRQHLRSVVTTNTQRFVNELRDLAERGQWEHACRRANDLADQLAVVPPGDAEIGRFIDGLRKWGRTFSRLASGQLKRLYNKQWGEFLVLLQGKLDSLRPQFPGTETPDDPGQDTTRNR